MATKKDLVEAYSFSRRRLVTAFVSGAPGGREVEPSRPGRTIIGGIALAVLLVAGALVLGILKSPETIEWGDEVLVGEKGTGADFVNISPVGGGDPQLHPIINITSAMLLLGPDLVSTPVSQEEVADRKRYETLGILGAPSTPPRASNLVQDGWTACTTAVGGPALGTKLNVDPQSDAVQTPSTSFVVQTPDGDRYLVAESSLGWDRPAETRAYAYPVPDDRDNAGRILRAVAGSDDPVPVSGDWITLFPPGRELSLRTFGLDVGDLGTTSAGRGAGLGAHERAGRRRPHGGRGPLRPARERIPPARRVLRPGLRQLLPRRWLAHRGARRGCADR